jgi:hypothetical protein
MCLLTYRFSLLWVITEVRGMLFFLLHFSVCKWCSFTWLDAQVLFESVIGSFSPFQARPLWDMWLQYQYRWGDVEAIENLERRMKDKYPEPAKRDTMYSGRLLDSLDFGDDAWLRARIMKSEYGTQ